MLKYRRWILVVDYPENTGTNKRVLRMTDLTCLPCALQKKHRCWLHNNDNWIHSPGASVAQSVPYRAKGICLVCVSTREDFSPEKALGRWWPTFFLRSRQRGIKQAFNDETHSLYTHDVLIWFSMMCLLQVCDCECGWINLALTLNVSGAHTARYLHWACGWKSHFCLWGNVCEQENDYEVRTLKYRCWILALDYPETLHPIQTKRCNDDDQTFFVFLFLARNTG